jgi:hypothetical protein
MRKYFEIHLQITICGKESAGAICHCGR